MPSNASCRLWWRQRPTAFDVAWAAAPPDRNFCWGFRAIVRLGVRIMSVDPNGGVVAPDVCPAWYRDGTTGRRGTMTALVRLGQFGDVGSMSGLPEGGHGWTIYGCTPRTKHRPQGWLCEKSAAVCGRANPCPSRCAILDQGRKHVRDRPPSDSEQFRSAPRTCRPLCGRLRVR
jgi:hypothetical protein